MSPTRRRARAFADLHGATDISALNATVSAYRVCADGYPVEVDVVDVLDASSVASCEMHEYPDEMIEMLDASGECP